MKLGVVLAWAVLLAGCGMPRAMPVAWAGQREVDLERAHLAAQGKSALTFAEELQLATRGWRDRRLGEYDPPVAVLTRPADYVSSTRRGTLEYHARWRNYSWHRIQVPNGTVIDCREGGNFTQLVPNTEAFDRTPGVWGHNLTFIECNLTNVKTYPDWTLQHCNTAQVWMKGTSAPDGTPEVQDTELVAPRSRDVPAVLVPPAEALQ